MMPISIINLILSIFGICVSSIFILFWCGRYFCAHFLLRRTPSASALLLSRMTINRRATVDRSSTTGVNPLVIAYFPTMPFNQEMFRSSQDAMCAVCLGDYKEGELLRFLPQCGHNFHVSCIDAWLQQHATCPVCRMSLQGYFVGRLIPPLHSVPMSRNDSGSGPGPGNSSDYPGSRPSNLVPSVNTNLPCNNGAALENAVTDDSSSQRVMDVLDSHVVDVGMGRSGC